MTTRARTRLALLAVGAGLLVAAIVLGILAALRFRDFVQYGYHPNGSCVPLPGHPGASTTLAWIALECAAGGLLAALGGLFADRRVALLVAVGALGISSAVAMWVNWTVLQAITGCVPYVNR